MRLILLRHGETVWNSTARLQGHADSCLSARGIKQVTSIRASIEQLAPQRIVTSDLGRALQTAQILGYPDATRDRRLREIDMGTWTGLSKLDLLEDSAEQYQHWRAGSYTPPSGESWPDFCHRIDLALRFWVEQASSDLLAVVHSGVIRAACHRFLNIAPDQLLPVTPATITIFNFSDQRHAPPKLEGYNIGSLIPDSEVAD